MYKKENIWVLVFFVAPIVFFSFAFFVSGENLNFRGLLAVPNKTTTPTKQGTFTGVNLKVPLFDTVTIPLRNKMTFIYEGKQYSIIQTGTLLISDKTTLVPIIISNDKGNQNYFIVAYIKKEKAWIQRQNILLGDNIKINNMSFSNEILNVDYNNTKKEKNNGKEITTNYIKYFKFVNGNITPYFPNIDNGALKDMSIIQNTWIWSETLTQSGSKTTPKNKEAFTVKMNEEGDFLATTDCNSLIGKFNIKGETASFSGSEMIKKSCSAGLQQDLFFSYLKETKAYDFVDGKFILILNDKSKVYFEKIKK